MASRSKRTHILRAAVAVAAVAAPLAAAGSAQAAIAGAAPASTTNLPDLVSAAASGPSTIVVTYDKALTAATVSSADGFYLSDYLSGTALSTGSGGVAPYQVVTSGDTATLQFANSTSVDLGAGTVLTSGTNSVAAASGATGAGGATSLADSTTVTSSNSQTGTNDHTAGPDLVSAKPTSTATTNTITYTFDKNVDPFNVTSGDFDFVYVTGTPAVTSAPIVATSAVASGNTVTATFPAAVPTTDANIAYATEEAVYSAGTGTPGTETGEVASQPGSFDINGPTTDATLTSATLNAAAPTTGPTSGVSYSTVTYTFDHTVTTTTPGDLTVALSDGSVLPTGTVISGTGTNSITVAYSTLSPIAEYAVQAVDYGDGANGNSTPSSTGIGGNAGLQARGYTTGPDVQAVVAEGDNNDGDPQFLVYIDQPLGSTTDYNPAEISLVGTTGQIIDSGSVGDLTVTPGPQNGLGQQELLLTFDNGSEFFFGNATQVDFAAGAFYTALNNGSSNEYSVPQIVTFTGTAAHIKAIKSHVAKKHVVKKHVAKKHVAKKHVVKKASK